MNTVFLPAWKAYLYSLLRRYKMYKRINMGLTGFGLVPQEASFLRDCLNKYLTKEERRYVKAVQYDLLYKRTIDKELTTQKEYNLISKLNVIKLINLEDLIMELKQLKAFAKEVGLKAADIKGMDEEELIITIMRNVDPDGEYTEEFVEWYEELDDEYYDQADAIEEEKEEDEIDAEELINEINDCKKMKDLEEVLEEYGIEDFDLDDYSSVVKAKKALIQFIEEMAEEEEEDEPEEEVKPEPKKGKGKAKQVKEEEPEEEEEVEVTADNLVDMINECTETKELKELAEEIEDNPFASIKWREGRGRSPFRDVDEVKKEMLSIISDAVEEDEPEEEVKPEPKKRGRKKAAVKEEEPEEEVETEEIEVTEEMVDLAIKEKDTETLTAICEQLDIKLNSFEKVVARTMGRKIKEQLELQSDVKGRPAKKKEPVDTEEPTKQQQSDKVTPYMIVVDGVLNGKSDDYIIKQVTPLWKSRGKSARQIKQWVQQLAVIVEIDYDIDPESR